MAARLLIQTAIWLAVMAALLFGSAGTMAWPQAWVFLVESCLLGLIGGVWLASRDPGLLDQRLRLPVQRDQPLWDKIIVSAIIVLFLGWFVLMGLDGGRWRVVRVPLWAQVIGAVGILISTLISVLALRENSFAAPVVKLQKERGHFVVATGPYLYVRHPMYAGFLVYVVSTALLLGSIDGLSVVPAFVVLFGLRAVQEERFLMSHFPDYREYASRVAYRIVPFVW